MAGGTAPVGGMTRFAAVSTFNADGLALYGQTLARTFDAFWPADVDLRLYCEGWDAADLAPIGRRVEVLELAAVSPWLTEFKTRHAHRTFRNFRYDGVRFSHKVAALCHAAQSLDPDYLIWLDGDIVTHAPLTLADLQALAPGADEWVAWLDRRFPQYPECGFYILNCRHKDHESLIGCFEAMYRDGHLYGLSEYHDSYVLQHVVMTCDVKWKSLSGAGWDTHHPLVNGPLGAWFDHLKGDRKRGGRSRRSDLRVRRQEDYWK
jgi:hypothetical protein